METIQHATKNQWVNEKIKKEIKKYLETNNNEDTNIRGKFIAIQAFLKKEERSQIDNLTHHLNELEKEEQTKPKFSRKKEIIKIKEEINKIEIQKIIEKITQNPWDVTKAVLRGKFIAIQACLPNE